MYFFVKYRLVQKADDVIFATLLSRSKEGGKSGERSLFIFGLSREIKFRSRFKSQTTRKKKNLG